MDAILRNRTYRWDEAFVVEQGTRILDKVGLAQYRDTPAGNLPYGLQRKVEIARALAMKPEILLLDEPAAGMNPLETQSLLQRRRRSGYISGCKRSVPVFDAHGSGPC